MTLRDLSSNKIIRPKKKISLGKPSIGALMAAVSVSALCLAAPGVARAQDSNGVTTTVNSDSTDLIFSSESDIDGSLAGVVAINNGSGFTDISVTNVTSGAGAGVSVTTASTTGELLLDATGSITAVGGSGVYIDHDGSEVAAGYYPDVVDIDVTSVTATGGTETKYAAGIDVDASAGKYGDHLDVYITATGAVDADDSGVLVNAKYADIDIDLESVTFGGKYGVAVTGGGADGSFADVDVTATGAIASDAKYLSSSKYAAGVLVQAKYADIDVDVQDVSTYNSGIIVAGSGSYAEQADIDIDAGAITAGSGKYGFSSGVAVQSYGALVDIETGAITAADVGVVVIGKYNDITIDVTDDLVVDTKYSSGGSKYLLGSTGGGVLVSAGRSDIDIDVDAVTTKYSGILVYGGGASGKYADIDVAASGDISAEYGSGVEVYAEYADIDIDVVGVTAKYDGIGVDGGGDSTTFADIDVTATGDIDAEEDGVYVSAYYADIDIDVAGVTAGKYHDAVTVNASGVDGSSLVSVYVDTAGDVYGDNAVDVDASYANVYVTLGADDDSKYTLVNSKYAAIEVDTSEGVANVTVDEGVYVVAGASKYSMVSFKYGNYNLVSGIDVYSDSGSVDVTIDGVVFATESAVEASGSSDSGVTVATGENSTLYGLTKYGIDASGDSGVYIYSDGGIYAELAGINAESTSGNVYVSVGSTGSVVSKYGTSAIDASSSSGDISVIAGGYLNAKYGDGIYANTFSGDYASVTVDGTVYAEEHGVLVSVGSGVDVNVYTGSDSSITSENASGIFTANKYSEVYISVDGDITAYAYAVYARTSSTDIDIYTGSDSSITSETEDGIYATSVDGDLYASVGGAVSADDDGIDLEAKYGDITVQLGTSADVDAFQGDGIDADAKYGDVSISVAGSIYSERNDAIDVESKYGSVYVNIAETGALYSNSKYSDSGDHGIQVYAEIEEIAVIVDGTIDAAGNGLNLIADENRIEVQTGAASSITSADDGIYAEADASVEITINGSVYADYNGLDLSSYDDDITVVVGETGAIEANIEDIKYGGFDTIAAVAEEDISITVDGSLDANDGTLMSLYSERGDISVDIGETALLVGDGGIYAETVAGETSLLPEAADITINFDGTAYVEDGGISAFTANGNVTITTGEQSYAYLADGINVSHVDKYVDGVADDVSITISGVLVANSAAINVGHVGSDVVGDDADGPADGGNVSIAVSDGAFVGFYGDNADGAIQVYMLGVAGDVNIDVDGYVSAGSKYGEGPGSGYAAGVHVESYGSGDVVITTGEDSLILSADSSAVRVISSGSIGKYVETSFSGASGNIDIDIDGAILSGDGPAVLALGKYVEDISVDLGSTGTITANGGNGILAGLINAVPFGKYVESGVSSSISVNVDGTIYAEESGVATGFIGKYSESGSIDVTVGADALIVAGEYGVFAAPITPTGADVSIAVDGTVVSYGSDAIAVVSKYVGGYDAVNVTVDLGADSQTGSKYANGVDVVTQGDVVITADGEIYAGSNGIIALGSTVLVATGEDSSIYVEGDGIRVSDLGFVPGPSLVFGPLKVDPDNPDLTVNVINDGDIDAGGIGIYAEAVLLDASVQSSGTITSGSDGIALFAGGSGYVDVTGDITAGSSGIYAEAGKYVAVDVVGDIASYDHGIRAITYDGPIYVDVVGDITTSDGDGMFVTGEGGDVDISLVGDIGAGGWGIDASTYSGDVTVNVVGDVSSYSYAVSGVANGGAVDIDVVGDISSAYAEGVSGFATGFEENVDIDVTGNVSARFAGIDAYSNAGAVDVVVVGDVSSDYAEGIRAVANYSGELSVDVTGNITAGEEGIDAYADGDVTLAVSGDITAGDDGIDAFAYGDATLTFSGDITAGDEGIEVFAYGDATLAVSGDITAGDEGIDVFAQYDATLAVSGDITAGDEGIDVDAYGALAISVDGDVSGDDAGIRTYASGDTTIDILADASVTGGDGTISDLAIGAYSEFGSVELSLAAGSVVNGTATLGDGDDTFNTVHGNFTRIDGGDGDDVANLSGIGFTIAGSGLDQQFDNVETFNISGQNYVLTGDHSDDAVVANFLSGSHSMIGDLLLPTITAADGVDLMLGKGLSITGDLISEATIEIAGVGTPVTIDGDLTLGAGSEVHFDVSNLRSADNITVSGQVTVAGGIVVDQGDVFIGDVVLIGSDTPVIGSFDSISGLVNGLLVNQSITIDNDVSLLSVLPDPNSVDALTVNNVALGLYTQTMAQNGLPQIPAAPNHPDKVISIPSRDFARMVRNILDEDNADTLATTLTDIGAETAGVGSVAAQAGTLRFVDGLLSGYSSVDGGNTKSADLGNGHLWLQLGQSTQEFDPSDMIGFDADGEAIMAGVDDVSFGQLTLGGAVSFSEQELDLEGLGRDEVDSEVMRLGAYATMPFETATLSGHVTGAVSMTDGSSDVISTVLSAGLSEARSGSTDFNGTSGAIRLGLDGVNGNDLVLKPYIGVMTDSYNQDAMLLGGGVSTLLVDKLEVETQMFSIGVTFDEEIADGTRLAGSVSSYTNLDDDHRKLTSRFASNPDNLPLVTELTQIGDLIAVEAGVSRSLGMGWNVELDGHAEFGDVEGSGVTLRIGRSF